MRSRCPDCGGTGKRPKNPKIFLLGEPVCVTCQGEGQAILNGLALDRVRELRSEFASYRMIAQAIHREFGGTWRIPDAQFIGEELCDLAGIDRQQEFADYCKACNLA